MSAHTRRRAALQVAVNRDNYIAESDVDAILNAAGVPDLMAACTELFDAYDDDVWVPDINEPGDAPGHQHTNPGFWDSTGEKCRWCTAWNNLASLTR